MKFPQKAQFTLTEEFGFGPNPIEVDVLAETHEDGMYNVRVPAVIAQAANQDNSGIRGSWFDADGSQILTVCADFLEFAAAE